MGTTRVAMRISRPGGRGPVLRLHLLIDTGVRFTVLPERAWRRLRLKPMGVEEFGLADGTGITRGLSECRFELGGRSAVSPVVLGEGEDAPLLGAVTLETLRFMVNPLTREVVPIPVIPLRPVLAGVPA